MDAIETLRQSFPDYAKDTKLNLQNVLSQSSLSDARKWGTAAACAIVCGSATLRDAIFADAAAAGVSEETLTDAKAAASLMAMNNTYYRFRHQVGGEYEKAHPKLRMNHIARPASDKVDFELFSLAVSAIHGCEVCMRAHDKVVRDAGVSQQEVVDAIRIASTIRAAAVVLSML